MLKNVIIAVLSTMIVVSGLWMWYLSADDEQHTISLSTLNFTAPQVKEKSPVKIMSIELPEVLAFADHEVPLSLFYVRESLERELVINTYWHSSTLMLLKRANRWFPVIDPILKEYGVPDDFRFLCMIESNLTNARSPAGAVGFWQFLEGTAKDFGLEVNKDVDERYHVEKSTHAACRYLLKSYARFQNWALVAASYNAGQKRIAGFIEKQKASSYFDLHMAEETDRYLHRILAMKLIFSSPETYGFYPEVERLYPPLEYELVKVSADVKDLADFAAKHGISYKLLKYFNPWLRSEKLNVKRGHEYEVKIPKGDFALTHRSVEDSMLLRIVELDGDSLEDGPSPENH
jgi:hypothetical protein